MTRIVFARAVKWRQVRGGIKAMFSECSRCYALVEGERARNWHEHWHEDLDALISGEVELSGAAPPELAEFSRPHPWREAWRQVAACLRLRPPRDPRPAVSSDPPTTAGRAEQWAAIDGLIKRTTEA